MRIKDAARKVNEATQKADDFVMALCQPDQMTTAMAIEFLELVMLRCESAIEALREEQEDED